MELTWTPKEVPFAADGSAYAEFWLNAPGSVTAQVALAAVVGHIGPVLQELIRSSPRPRRQGGDDPPATAT